MFGERIERLVLADPAVSGPGRRPYVKSLSFYLDSIHEAREGRADVEAIRKTYPNWTDEQLRNRAEWLHTCDDAAIEKSLRGLNEEDIHGDLPHLKMPTLLVQAGKGGVILEEDVADMKRLLPALQVKTIPQSGQMLPFDDLPAFLASMAEFLK